MTISTHNGSKVARSHNLRNRTVTDKEEHIDRNGTYEIWYDENPRKAYTRLFGDSVKEFNARQKNKDRIIDNYYAKIANDPKKHPVYEMIISIGNADNRPDEKNGKEIMKAFADGWKERNPNLELIGVYYHADETGVPHVHLDYIPVGYECQRGMKVQNALKQALKEQGFIGQSATLTAQMKWQERENTFLENLCKARGLEIEHPQKGSNAKHMNTDEYKIIQEQKEQILDKTKYTQIQEKKPGISGSYKYSKEEHQKVMTTTGYYEFLSQENKKLKKRLQELREKEKQLDAKEQKLNQDKERQDILWHQLLEINGSNKDALKLQIFEELTKSLHYGDAGNSVYEGLFLPQYKKKTAELEQAVKDVFAR